ncbi:MAG: response regulator transcription factor [Gammaproteobacteria bacterium]|nr:response regulator transcription factor [Gammaproteobacteria bacterium]
MAKILIVDDNALFRESLRDILQVRFPTVEIDEAKDGEEALMKVEAHSPDLIFMDIHLPGENGLEVTKKVKAGYPHIVIVVVTNYDLPEYRDAAFRSGANGFLSKDSTTKELLTLVQSTLFD